MMNSNKRMFFYFFILRKCYNWSFISLCMLSLFFCIVSTEYSHDDLSNSMSKIDLLNNDDINNHNNNIMLENNSFMINSSSKIIVYNNLLDMLTKLWKEIMILVIICLVIIHVIWFIVGKKLKRMQIQRPSSRNGSPDKPISPIKVPFKSKELSVNLQTVLFGPIKASVNQSRYESDFEHIEEIGWGGFGRVFKALHKITSCYYAIKRIEVPNCEYAKKKVLREVTALSLLDHPGIVRFYNAWFDYVKDNQKKQNKMNKEENSFESSYSVNNLITFGYSSKSIIIKTVSGSNSNPRFKWSIIANDGSKRVLDCNQNELFICDHSTHVYLYIQMQLCIKDTLKDWLLENIYDRDICISRDIFKQLLSAVSYLHDQGLIHRDLKPSNIFFAQDGTIKIGDFGLVSCFTTISTNREFRKNHCFSDNTSFAGTELYMSPEQLQNKSYDFKVDIYSLGLIYIDLLVPFITQMERYKTLNNVKNGIISFSELEKKELELIKKMLSSDPVKRPSANQTLDQLYL